MRACLAMLLCLTFACDGRASSAPEHDADIGDDGGGGQRGMDAQVLDGPVCGPAGDCDLFSPGDCGEGLACRLSLGDADADAGVAEAEAASDALAPTCGAAGQGHDGSPCTHPEACGAGLDCSAFGGEGRCRRHCCGLNAVAGCPAGQFCRVALLDVDDSATGLALCDACDSCALSGDDCGADSGCYLLDDGASGCRACLPAGAGQHGDACDAQNDCDRGHLCTRAGGTGRCAALCELAGGACPGDAACTAVAGVALDGGWGLCR